MSLVVRDIYSGYFRDVNVLRGVSLEVCEGSITAVLGPNGSGKSTLLKTIYGYLKPSSGKILLDGHDITGMKTHDLLRMGLAYVAQESGIFPHLTVEENLKTGLWILRKEKHIVRERLEEIYNRFEILSEKRNVKAGFLSGGQQRLLQIAKALLTKPRIILMDEPSSGLSPKVLDEVYGIITKLRDEGKTILLVEQNVRKALEVADAINVIELGQTKFSGTKREFEERLEEIIGIWGFKAAGLQHGKG